MVSSTPISGGSDSEEISLSFGGWEEEAAEEEEGGRELAWLEEEELLETEEASLWETLSS